MTSSHDYRLADGTGTDAFTRPAWFTDVDDVRQLSDRLKRLIEERRWPEVESLVGLDAIWAFDRPMPLGEAVAAAAAVLEHAVDIHLWFEKILKAQAADGAGHLTLNCCLMWGEEGNLKDHEFDFDFHLGFGQDSAGAWGFRYLGVTPGTPEYVPFPTEGKPAHGEAPAASTATGTAAAAPAAWTLAAPAAWALAGGGLALPPGHVVAYLPVVVPAAALAGGPASVPAPAAPEAEEAPLPAPR